MEPQRITAAQFWDLYFANRFVTLKRDAAGYLGQARSGAPAGAPGRLLAPLDLEPVRIDRGALSLHDSRQDQRFALLKLAPRSLGEAFNAVIADTYPYRDAAPYGRARMAELLRGVSLQLNKSGGPATTADAAGLLRSMVEGHEPALDQPIAALSWLLGEQRDPRAASSLLLVLRNSSHVAFSRRQVHFTAFGAALVALWKSNDKLLLPEYLALLTDARDSGKYLLAGLLERLFSPDTLWSMREMGEGYVDASAWSARLAFGRDFALEDWNLWDAQSVFWENRLSAASRLGRQGRELQARRLLADDEVSLVGQASLA